MTNADGMFVATCFQNRRPGIGLRDIKYLFSRKHIKVSILNKTNPVSSTEIEKIS